MLEIRNLTKIYKSKGGVIVKALDDVSTKFPENGMIFLLGKSGSGKSTLLNVCGGLDTPTSGEIIVKGRSSVNFKQSDFDSYRNTFIGFIFQEYNILDEFTVEENIALALELQGKEKDVNAINELLLKVELNGYNKRKPNTLSGGQKQRLAIARALVKNPEIIMADEPTGALDSETGKQVFDTLKVLSKDTLVIVVSHDREFAEKYADRIIELKDGKIISDLTREKNNFVETKEEKIEIKKYSKKDSKFISSNFSIKNAIKMGLSSLKVKKLRLIMTIFLCTVAFTMFGLLSTLMFYDRESTFKDTFSKSNVTYIQLTKEYQVNETMYFDGEENYTDIGFDFGRFTDKEVSDYIKQYGDNAFGAVTTDIKYNVQDTSIPYWINSINTFAYLEENSTYRKSMIGSYPLKNDELAISSYMADVIINTKIDDYDTGKTLNIKERDELIGKKIKLKDEIYTITGIIDSGLINSKFESLKQYGKVEDAVYAEFMKELQNGLHLITFVNKERLSIEAMEYRYNYDNFSERMINMAPYIDKKYDFDRASYGYYSSFDKVGGNYNYLKFKDFNNLSDNVALVSYDYLAEMLMNKNINNEKINNLVNVLYSGGEHVESKNGDYIFKKYSYEVIKEKASELFNLIKNKNIDLSFGVKSYNPYEGTAVGQTYEFEIVGIFIPYGYTDNLVIVNNNVYQKLLNYEINNFESVFTVDTKYYNHGMYDVVYIPFEKDEENINALWSIRSNEKLDKLDSKVDLTGSIILDLDIADDIVNDFSKVFFYVGLVLAVFASLLFSNFISVSISNKRKEIGILRAIGAKGVDVFKIFFSESIILSIICVILSSIGTIIISNVFNNVLDLGVSVFVFGIASLIIIILIAILTAFISTFIPVYNAARKKPIESIRAV